MWPDVDLLIATDGFIEIMLPVGRERRGELSAFVLHGTNIEPVNGRYRCMVGEWLIRKPIRLRGGKSKSLRVNLVREFKGLLQLN